MKVGDMVEVTALSGEKMMVRLEDVRSSGVVRCFLMTWWFGLCSGYPLCCIHEFVMDSVAGRLPAQLRESDAERGFVPCLKCLRCKKNGRV